ncbi:MAG: hypothetical protein KAW41_03990 [Candidatus Diapherotrites archaeon]|nr:hypothetical protein [Candidatus Diapherotrites archaeon]
MKAQKQWIFLALIVVISIGITSYFGTSHSERAELNVSAHPQPAAIGYATIRVDSSIPLNQISVLLPDREATLDRQEGNSYFFSYFVSPYDDVGLKQISVYATDENGHKLLHNSEGLYVDYNAAGDKQAGIIFYSYHWNPLLKAALLGYSPEVNFFFEVKPGEDPQGAVDAFVPLVFHLASEGVNVSVYGVQADGDWLSCTNSSNAQVPVEKCRQALEEPSIILRYPSYPTTQVHVGNSTIDIQPAPGDSQKAVNATIGLLREGLPYFLAIPAEPGNLTEGNLTA